MQSRRREIITRQIEQLKRGKEYMIEFQTYMNYLKDEMEKMTDKKCNHIKNLEAFMNTILLSLNNLLTSSTSMINIEN